MTGPSEAVREHAHRKGRKQACHMEESIDVGAPPRSLQSLGPAEDETARQKRGVHAHIPRSSQL